MKKTAVVLFNLGGPDSQKSIRPFLFNFFMDKNIIRAPLPVRFLVACLIAFRRSKKEAGKSYGLLGGKSPLLENTKVQAAALEKELGGNFKVFVCMRYWHPMAPEAVREVKEWGAEEILLLPLYPQFSTTTTWSSLGAWHKAAKMQNIDVKTGMVCCYPANDGFLRVSAENIRSMIEVAKTDGHHSPRILFSAHGLPEDVIRNGDPYQWQCEQGAAKIAEALGLKPEDWRICYQSRVGPKKWIGPSTEEALREAARDQKPVIIYPHAFTQEHVETLVELDIEYQELAHHLGLPGYYRAATVGTHPEFITGLARLVRDHLGRGDISSESHVRLCPPQFGRCCMEKDLSCV